MTTSAHDSHDLLLIAEYAADDAGPADRERAQALLAACTACANLAADIRSIAAATAALPPIARQRDFRLTDADAARLRPAGWRRAIQSLAGPRLAFTRPLAAGLTTLGLVGVIVTSVPIGMFGSATSGSAPQAAPAPASAAAADAPIGAGGAAPQPGFSTAQGATPRPSAAAAYDRGSALRATASPSPAALGPVAAPASGTPLPDQETVKGGPIVSPAPPTAPAESGDAVTTAGEPDNVSEGPGSRDTNLFAAEESGVSPSFLLSAALLICGVGLFLLRWTARRLD